MKAYRRRRRAEGFRERSVRLTPENAERAVEMAGERGTDFSGLVNELIAEASA